MYFCLCESRHYDHVLNIVDKKNYNKLLKSDDYNILFSKKYDKSFMRNKSFLINLRVQLSNYVMILNSVQLKQYILNNGF